MIIDAIQNGMVIDHIDTGKAMELYSLLHLERADCPVAIIQRVPSRKMGTKDIIKIDGDMHIDTDVLGFVSPDATVNIIKDSHIVEKKTLALPPKLTNVLHCKNPRCIISTEQELPSVFVLTDKNQRIYRCLYCETQAEF